MPNSKIVTIALVIFILGIIICLVFFFFMNKYKNEDAGTSEQPKYSGYLTLSNDNIVLIMPNTSFILAGSADIPAPKKQMSQAAAQNKSVLFTGTGSLFEKALSPVAVARYLRVDSYETKIGTHK